MIATEGIDEKESCKIERAAERGEMVIVEYMKAIMRERGKGRPEINQ